MFKAKNFICCIEINICVKAFVLETKSSLKFFYC